MEKLAAARPQAAAEGSQKPRPDIHLAEVQGRMREALQSPVEIRGKGSRGRVVVSYRSADELNRILRLFEQASDRAVFKREGEASESL